MLCGDAEAKEFKEQYEKAMDENAPLLTDAPLAPPPEEKVKDPEMEKKVDELAEKIAETTVVEAANTDKES